MDNGIYGWLLAFLVLAALAVAGVLCLDRGWRRRDFAAMAARRGWGYDVRGLIPHGGRSLLMTAQMESVLWEANVLAVLVGEMGRIFVSDQEYVEEPKFGAPVLGRTMSRPGQNSRRTFCAAEVLGARMPRMYLTRRQLIPRLDQVLDKGVELPFECELKRKFFVQGVDREGILKVMKPEVAEALAGLGRWPVEVDFDGEWVVVRTRYTWLKPQEVEALVEAVSNVVRVLSRA